MAVVFLAQDLRHDRKVALKVLRPDLSAAIGADRFLREIKLAAGLTHPHILPVYDSGRAGDLLFYVMPNMEGRSLRERLQRERQLPLPDALTITREVASALDYAHRHQVVHRDIKPENILLHEGSAMVADFGIGKALSARRLAHADRDGRGHPDLHEPRAGIGGLRRGRPHRSLQPRVRAVRDADRRAAVHRRVGAGGDRQALRVSHSQGPGHPRRAGGG